jgi:hypothetical protein
MSILLLRRPVTKKRCHNGPKVSQKTQFLDVHVRKTASQVTDGHSEVAVSSHVDIFEASTTYFMFATL